MTPKEEYYDEIRKEKQEEMKQDAREDEWYERQMYTDQEFCAEKLDIVDIVEELKRAIFKYEEYGHSFECSDWI